MEQETMPSQPSKPPVDIEELRAKAQGAVPTSGESDVTFKSVAIYPGQIIDGCLREHRDQPIERFVVRREHRDDQGRRGIAHVAEFPVFKHRGEAEAKALSELFTVAPCMAALLSRLVSDVRLIHDGYDSMSNLNHLSAEASAILARINGQP